MPELVIYPVVGLGNYGSAWDATLKTASDEYNKVQSVSVNTTDQIYTNQQSEQQSFKFAQRGSGLSAIESVTLMINCKSDAPSGARIKVRAILPSSGAWQELTIYPTDQMTMVQFELVNAPDGLGWTPSKFNELQAINFSYLIVDDKDVIIESLEAYLYEAV